MPKKKDLLIFALKFLFSFSIIAYLLIKIAPINDIVNVVKEAHLVWLILSFFLHGFGYLFSVIRWQILIKAQGDFVPLRFLAKSYLVAGFFNNFLPTRFGGDIVRIWDGSRYSRSLLKSSAIVLVDRFTGIVVLLVFASIASLLRLDMANQIPVIWVSLFIGLGGLLIVALFFSPLARWALQKIPEKGFLLKVKQKLFEFKKVILIYKDKKSSILRAFFWAFLLQVNVIVHYYLIGLALNLRIGLLDYFVFVPIVLLILSIPITINGLGLREGSYLEIFRFYGIPSSTSVSFGLIDWAFGFILGLAGGIVYITRK